MDDLEAVRRRYAEELKYVAHTRSAALVHAFATVPRERFLGPGPWQVFGVLGGVGDYWPTEDADPRHVYHNVLIALDAARGINNGQPSLWAYILDALDPQIGETVAHLGCGTGYYSAILAEVVGTKGHVLALEIDGELAARARTNLRAYANVEVREADACRHDLGKANAIVVSAGATHPLPRWLDALSAGGRLIFPLTSERRGGGVLKVTRGASAYAARFVCPAFFVPCTGARDDEANRRLEAALGRGNWQAVNSLRRDGHALETECWLHGEGYCLSTRDPMSAAP